MSQTDAIPVLAEIDEAWLTSILVKAGHESAKVSSFDSETIGTGQIGKCVRFTLELTDGATGAPTTLIGKFPSDNPNSRQTGTELRQYLKEISFYRDIQSQVSISTPNCYFADIADDEEHFALILEDMHPATQGNQLAGCSVELVGEFLNELVGLHGPTWCNNSLLDNNPFFRQTAEEIRNTKGRYDDLIEGFIQRFGHALSPEQVDVYRSVATATDSPFTQPDKAFSLIHLDYRLDNFLIDTTTDKPSVAVVDWQTVTSGNPLSDVSYVIASSLTPEQRRESERPLLETYHRALVEQGVKDYSWEDCWTDYRRGSFSGFSIAVIAPMLVKQTDRGDEMFTLMAQRFSQQALDLNAKEFL